MEPRRHTKSKGTAARWILGALVLAGALLVALTLWGLRDSGGRSQEDRPKGSVRPAAPALAPAAAPKAPPEIGEEIPPSRATTENTPELPAGTVPAWTVDPPPPDPSAPAPPAPHEPPNPATHRAPMDNPGGVNSDRPERTAPGLE